MIGEGFLPLINLIVVLFFVINLTFTRAIILILCLAGLLVYSIYTNQESMLYQANINPAMKCPKDNPPLLQAPIAMGMNYEEVWLKTRDGEKLHSWFIPAAKNKSIVPTVLWFHANAGNMGLRIPAIKFFTHRIGVNVFIISYRGYGASSGTPSESGLIIDGETALDHLHSRTGTFDEEILSSIRIPYTHCIISLYCYFTISLFHYIIISSYHHRSRLCLIIIT